MASQHTASQHTHDGLATRLLEQQSFMQGLARALCRDAFSADDLVQETVTVAIGSPSAAQASSGPRSLRAWLSRTMRRRAVDGHRRELRRRGREGVAARPDAAGSHEGAVDAKLDARHVLALALAKLPAAEARALELRYGEGLSPTRIAAESGAPVATVKTRLQRGLARLRAELDVAHQGDRGRWVTAFGGAELARMRSEGLGLNGLTGGLAAGALVLGGGMLWHFSPGGGPGDGAGQGASAGTPARSVAALDPDGGPLVSLPRVEQRSSAGPAPAEPEPSPAALPRVELLPSSAPEADDRITTVFPDEHSAATLAVRLGGEEDERIHGIIKLHCDLFEQPRHLELRGRTSPGEILHYKVPSDVSFTIEADFDGYLPLRWPVPGVVAGGEREVEVPLAVDQDWAHLSLSVDPASPVANGEFILRWVPADGASNLVMPMRYVHFADGVGQFGRLPAGAGAVTGSTHMGSYSSAVTYHTLINGQVELAGGARVLVPMDTVQSGAIRLHVVDESGQSIAASFKVHSEGHPTRHYGTRTETTLSMGTDSTVSEPALLTPQVCPPVPTVVTATADGYRPGSGEVLVRSGEVVELAISLMRL